MDTQEQVKDQLGNVLAVGDTVAYSGVSRHVPPVRVGQVVSLGSAGLVIKPRILGARSIGRCGIEVVKAALP